MNSTTTRKAGARAHAFLGTSNSIWEDNLEQGVGFLAFNKMQAFVWISPGMYLTSLFPVYFLTSKKGFTYIAVFFLCISRVLLLRPDNYFAKPVVTSIFLRALLSITSWTESNQWLQLLLWGMESDYASGAWGRSLISSGNDLKLWKTPSKLRENCLGGITINFSSLRVSLWVRSMLKAWTISQRVSVVSPDSNFPPWAWKSSPTTCSLEFLLR